MPRNSVVIPWRSPIACWGSVRSAPSAWVWGSMKPGATVRPVTSITRRASARARSATAATVSPWMPTSARRPGAPEPSTTVPPRSTRSNTPVPPLPDRQLAVEAGQALDPGLRDQDRVAERHVDARVRGHQPRVEQERHPGLEDVGVGLLDPEVVDPGRGVAEADAVAHVLAAARVPVGGHRLVDPPGDVGR